MKLIAVLNAFKISNKDITMSSIDVATEYSNLLLSVLNLNMYLFAGQVLEPAQTQQNTISSTSSDMSRFFCFYILNDKVQTIFSTVLFTQYPVLSPAHKNTFNLIGREECNIFPDAFKILHSKNNRKQLKQNRLKTLKKIFQK